VNFVSDFWRFLRSTPLAANLLALITLLLWVLKALIFDHLPAAFPGASELGKVVEGILSAVIAGWIFYLFFALLPEARQKEHLRPFVLRSVASLAGDAKSILVEIEAAAGNKVLFSGSTEAELTAAFTNVSFSSRTRILTNLNGTRATWLQFFHMNRERSRQRIAQIKEQSRFVEPEVIAMLLRLEQNPFFLMAEAMERYPFINKDLGVLASSFHKYLGDCRILIDWHDKHIVPPEVPQRPSLDQ